MNTATWTLLYTRAPFNPSSTTVGRGRDSDMVCAPASLRPPQPSDLSARTQNLYRNGISAVPGGSGSGSGSGSGTWSRSAGRLPEFPSNDSGRNPPPPPPARTPVARTASPPPHHSAAPAARSPPPRPATRSPAPTSARRPSFHPCDPLTGDVGAGRGRGLLGGGITVVCPMGWVNSAAFPIECVGCRLSHSAGGIGRKAAENLRSSCAAEIQGPGAGNNIQWPATVIQRDLPR